MLLAFWYAAPPRDQWLWLLIFVPIIWGLRWLVYGHFWTRTPLIHARMADTGGWNPDILQAEVGKPIELHFTSDDVVHGFAVGQLDMEAVDVEPGKVTDVTLTSISPEPIPSIARVGAESITGGCAARLKSVAQSWIPRSRQLFPFM